MASSSEVMLEEMRCALGTAYESARKYSNKTFTAFGAELALLLFYLANDEMQHIKNIFSSLETGWWIFAVLALLAFLVAAVLFIISMAMDSKWRFPPDPSKLIDEHTYSKMDPEELRRCLIVEYNNDINACIRRIHWIKALTNIGIYFLVAGVGCLLLIKLFGV